MQENPQKIYNMIRIDMGTGCVLEEDSFLYSGPVALCEGEEGPTPEQVTAANEAMAAAGIKGLDSWRDNLPEEIGTHASMEKFNGKPFHEVVSSYLNLEGKLGADPIVRPGEGASEEEVNAFYSALGRPGEAAGYEVGIPDDVPEGFKVAPAYVDEFKAAAHKAGLTGAQASQVWGFMLNKATGSYKASVDGDKTRLTGENNALKEEWGSAYDEKIKMANSVSLKIGGPELSDFLKTTGIGREPKIIKAFAEMGKYFAADDLGPGGPSSTLTPAEAMSKVNAIRSDPDHAYHDKKNPGHKAAVAEVNALYDAAYPDEK